MNQMLMATLGGISAIAIGLRTPCSVAEPSLGHMSLTSLMGSRLALRQRVIERPGPLDLVFDQSRFLLICFFLICRHGSVYEIRLRSVKQVVSWKTDSSQ
jgi:hypothetical protein